ncbi:S1C family serine protease [Salinispirillum marinum]|uniref:S1C family serine protease n=2 Tax=Saccharospirillaceae TaxID=255527 RepID=A0ABV8BDT5_9GAMM
MLQAWVNVKAVSGLMVVGSLLLSPLIHAQTSVKGQKALPANTMVESVLRLGGRSNGTERYRVALADDILAFEATLTAQDFDIDLALYNAHGEQIALADSYRASETLQVIRLDVPELTGGTYSLEVYYPFDDAPVGSDGNLVTTIPFTLEWQQATLGEPDRLPANVPAQGHLKRQAGMIAYYRVEVPAAAEALRIDVVDTFSDLDLFVFADQPSADIERSQWHADTMRAQEKLIITQDSSPPLRAGTYYVAVADLLERQRDIEFGLWLSWDAEPPQALDPQISLPVTEPGLPTSLLATVEVRAGYSVGSGTLVSPDGYVLTNHHVIEEYMEEGGDILLGMSLDHRLPTRELFYADLVDAAPERDMALLKVRATLYSEPLARYLPLPFIPIGDDSALRIGDDLITIGYPWVGGRWARGTVSFTRGYVSGFEADEYGAVIKTDAEFSAGNSGGAALNTDFELVGIPTETVGTDSGKLGYVYPISALPASWRALIAQ